MTVYGLVRRDHLRSGVDVDEEVAFTRQGKGHKSDSEYGESRNNQAFGEHGKPVLFFLFRGRGTAPGLLMNARWPRNASQKRRLSQEIFGSKNN